MNRFFLLPVFFVLLSFSGQSLALEQNKVLGGNTVKAVYVDKYNTKWFGTNNGLTRYDGNKWITYSTAIDTLKMSNDQINDIAYELTSYGDELWLATDSGITVMGYDEVDGITSATAYWKETTEMIHNHITSIAVDTSSNRWFGTPDGLIVYRAYFWDSVRTSTFGGSDGLPSNDITGLAIEQDSLYAGTPRGIGRVQVKPDGITGASYWGGDAFPWMLGLQRTSESINTLFIDSKKRQWVGTPEGAVWHEGIDGKNDPWDEPVNEETGLVDNNVIAIAEDADGNFWFGTTAGVSKFDGSSVVKSYTIADGLASDTVYDIDFDDDGSVWLATHHGVSRLKDGSFTNYYEAETTGIERHSRSPLSMNLYPNPFQGQVNIQFYQPVAGQTSISLYNIEGKKVVDIHQGFLPKGPQNLTWSAANSGVNLVPGIYTLAIRSEQFFGRQKMVIIQ